MADVAVDNTEAPEVCEKEIEKAAPEVDEDSKSENGDKPENGSEEKLENGDKPENGSEEKTEEDTSKVVKRKSGAGDGPDATAEGVSPEKKAKLDDKAAEAESNGEAEVAA